MPIYDRTLARMSRRELMKLAWMLGAAARRAADRHARACARAADLRCVSVHARRRVGRSAARRRRACGRGWRRSRSRAAACRWPTSSVDWEIARDARFQSDCAEGNDDAREARARSQRPCRGRRPRAWPRILVPLPCRRRSEPDRPHQDGAGCRRARSIACASPSAAAITTRWATSPRSAASPKSSSTSSSTPATTSTKGAPTAAADDRVRQHNGDETLHARRLPQPLCALQVRSRSAWRRTPRRRF